MKKNNKKGFTLAELLIVVAIIAVLTAIAIPVFSSQLERSREATDAANLRAAYAEVIAEGLSTGASNSLTVTAKQTDLTGWQNPSLAGSTIGDVAIPAAAASWTVAYSATTETVSIS